MDWACGTYGEEGRFWPGLVENREGQRPIKRPRLEWDGGTQMDLKLYSLPPMCGNGITRGQLT